VNEHSLPDDVRRWPDDPHELLGVARGVSPRELKRAYTRLIRRYKPEHHPDEFRRIRSAYESASQLAELFARFANEKAETPDAPSADGMSQAVGQPAEEAPAGAPASAAVRPFQPNRAEQIDQCWKWAVAGQTERAYRALCKLHAQEPHDPQACVRLYWLLMLSPRLDENRSPCDWLAAGLKRNGLNGPLRELYRRELVANPIEAKSQRCRDLLDAGPATYALGELVEWRWNAVTRFNDAVDIIREDLARLRAKILPHDDEMWARLVFAAVDRLAFLDLPSATDLRARCQRDLEGLAHLQLRLSAAFDRYELLNEIVNRRRTLLNETSGHEEFLEIVRLSWATSIDEFEPRLTLFLSKIAAAPGAAVKKFDSIKELGSPLLFQFRNTLSMLEQNTEPAADTRTPAQINELVITFVRETPGTKYADWRPQLLDFCLRELVMPEQVAAALAGNQDFTLTPEQSLSQAASADLPLVCVCHACRLFWA
jgi:hypothetical protein